VAAFGQKDIPKLENLIYKKNIPVGVRLDYFLPLYMAENDGGEDIFVASTKVMLGGDENHPVSLEDGHAVHRIGPSVSQNYTHEELEQLTQYVSNAFVIRNLLRNAPNKAVIQPTTEALEYILENAKDFRDSNDNPVIVFIPGAIGINSFSVSNMILTSLKNGADVNEIGFFGVPGIVWSIILGDVEGVQTFLSQKAKLTTEDEFGNQHAIAWATATHKASAGCEKFQNRLISIIQKLQINNHSNLETLANHLGFSPRDYLDEVSKHYISRPVTSMPALGDSCTPNMVSEESKVSEKSEETDLKNSEVFRA
ncbi:MAG: hypothetical protein JSS53_02595, partial [Proteobacteria bacterium]|nr:hypothetical protein [Pseudomonadota bacterium]